MSEWHEKATEKNYKFLSHSTYDGFQVTLQTAIDCAQYLTSNCGYKYLMTTRLNQDVLEVRYFL